MKKNLQSFCLGYTGKPKSHRNPYKLDNVLLKSNTKNLGTDQRVDSFYIHLATLKNQKHIVAKVIKIALENKKQNLSQLKIISTQDLQVLYFCGRQKNNTLASIVVKDLSACFYKAELESHNSKGWAYSNWSHDLNFWNFHILGRSPIFELKVAGAVGKYFYEFSFETVFNAAYIFHS